MFDHSFRDMAQLRTDQGFGFTAITAFNAVEYELAEALKFVPYCDEHLSVWSYQFGRIILEASSQLDSIWKFSTKLDDPSANTDRLTIANHHDRFGKHVEHQKVIVFSSPTAAVLKPFEAWIDPQNHRPEWWDAYNALKHDRYANQTKGTLGNALQSVAALMLAIVYSGHCDLAIINSKMLATYMHNVWAFTSTGLLRDTTGDCCSKIESGLFAHALGMTNIDPNKVQSWWQTDSPRFNAWWALNRDSIFGP